LQTQLYNVVEIQVFMIFRSATKEYLPITGMAEFNKLSAQLVFGADRYNNRNLHAVVLDLLQGTKCLNFFELGTKA